MLILHLLFDENVWPEGGGTVAKQPLGMNAIEKQIRPSAFII